MGSTKIFMGIFLGAICSGVMLSLAFYFFAVTATNTESPVGNAKDWKWAIFAFGAILGLVIGGAFGAIIAGFRLNILKAMLLGFILNFVLGAAFFVYTGGSQDKNLFYCLFALILTGVINGAIVSMVNGGGKSLE